MPSVRLVGWRGCGKGGESGILGVAAVRLVEVELVIRDLLIVRGDAGLRVLLPRGAAAVDQGSSVLRPVLQWRSEDVARRFATTVVAAAVVARYPHQVATALGGVVNAAPAPKALR